MLASFKATCNPGIDKNLKTNISKDTSTEHLESCKMKDFHEKNVIVVK